MLWIKRWESENPFFHDRKIIEISISLITSLRWLYQHSKVHKNVTRNTPLLRVSDPIILVFQKFTKINFKISVSGLPEPGPWLQNQHVRRPIQFEDKWQGYQLLWQTQLQTNEREQIRSPFDVEWWHQCWHTRHKFQSYVSSIYTFAPIDRSDRGFDRSVG